MSGTQATEVPALHRTGKSLTDCCAADINKLAHNKVVRRDFGTNRQELVFRHAEFSNLHFRFNFGYGKTSAFCTRHILDLGPANAELHGRIAVLVLRPMRDNLTAIELQNSHRDVLTGVCKDAGHTDLLCDNT